MQNIYQRRLVGQQPGVQVNMPIDRTDRLLPESGDQTIATVGWFNRGRVDRPFLVTGDKFSRFLGIPKSMRADARNEVYLILNDSFRVGAAGAVVSRLKSDEAVHKWVLIKHDGADVIASELTLPEGATWLLGIKVMDAINEGVYIQVSRSTENEEHLAVVIRERLKDSEGKDTAQGEILYEFEGSTDIEELDENGNSAFIGDVAELFYGDWLEIEVNPAASKILVSDAFASKKVSAGVEFYEDTGSLSPQNYTKAVSALKVTNIKFKYLLSFGGNLTFHSEMIALAPEINRKLFVEIPGNLSPEAVVAWLKNFNYDAQSGMYFDFNWSPVKRDDPMGISGNIVFGTIGQKAGLACARNAVTNSFGLPKLNQPIAGKDFYISGTRISQIYFPNDMELAELAKARVNPAIYSEYHDGSGYVWADSFSGAKKNGISKLASASEIAIWAQDTWGKFGKSLTQNPMTEAIEKAEKFTEKQLQDIETSKWLTPSVSLGGAAYAYTIKPNDRYPDDRLDIQLKLSIDGVVRVVTISTDLYSRT